MKTSPCSSQCLLEPSWWVQGCPQHCVRVLPPPVLGLLHGWVGSKKSWPACLRRRNLRGKTRTDGEDAWLPAPHGFLPLDRGPLTKCRRSRADGGREWSFLNGRNSFPFLERLWVIPLPFLTKLYLCLRIHTSPQGPATQLLPLLSPLVGKKWVSFKMLFK